MTLNVMAGLVPAIHVFLATASEKRAVQIIPFRIFAEDKSLRITMKRDLVEKGISDAEFQFNRMKKSED
jgi:hypothetical protein